MLPILSLPNFVVDLPSDPNTKFKFRPFLVKEEKLLLMNDVQANPQEAKDTVIDIIKACCLNENFDFSKLTYFDIEFLFLAIRARSVGEIQSVEYICQNIIDKNGKQGVCETPSTVDIDFTKMQVLPVPSSSARMIQLDNATVQMRYPTRDMFNTFEKRMKSDTPITEREIYELAVNFVALMVEKVITDSGALVKGKDFNDDQTKEWIENLTKANFIKLQDFVSNLPKVTITTHFKCPRCKFERDMVLEGLESFFE